MGVEIFEHQVERVGAEERVRERGAEAGVIFPPHAEGEAGDERLAHRENDVQSSRDDEVGRAAPQPDEQTGWR